MFGTDAGAAVENSLRRLEKVLDRETTTEPLPALAEAVDGRLMGLSEVTKVALGIDSSVFLKLATARQSADILDYLPRHKPPLILPGQTIQEFWNNRFAAVETVGASLRRRFQHLAEEVRKVDDQFGVFEQRATQMLDDFSARIRLHLR